MNYNELQLTITAQTMNNIKDVGKRPVNHQLHSLVSSYWAKNNLCSCSLWLQLWFNVQLHFSLCMISVTACCFDSIHMLIYFKFYH